MGVALFSTVRLLQTHCIGGKTKFKEAGSSKATRPNNSPTFAIYTLYQGRFFPLFVTYQFLSCALIKLLLHLKWLCHYHFHLLSMLCLKVCYFLICRWGMPPDLHAYTHDFGCITSKQLAMTLLCNSANFWFHFLKMFALRIHYHTG